MTTSSVFPDDLMMEYDLLQFMENDDASARQSIGSNSGTSAQFQFMNVDDLLGNSGLTLDSLDAVPTTMFPTNATVGENANKTTFANVGENTNANTTNSYVNKKGDTTTPTATANAKDSCEEELSADASSLLDDLFLNGDELLAHLEAEAANVEKAQSPQHAKTAASPCPSHCYTDPDAAASPCPSMASDCAVNCSSPKCFNDELQGMAKVDATSMSPSCTPTVATQSGRSLPQHMLRLTSSPSLDGSTEHDGSTEDDESGSSAGSEQEEDEIMEIMTPVKEEQTEESIDMEDESSVQHNSDLLAKEAKYLEAQYDYLLSRAKSARAGRQSVKAKRRMREDKQQIVQKTGDNALLTQLVAQQQVYMDNFKAMLAFAPVNDIRMALMTPIESYIRLGRDFDERRRTILSLREEKLDMTYKYIEEKARGIDITQPYQYSDVFERFGKYYSVHFAVSRYEGVEVGQVVKVVYDQMAGTDESLASAMGCLSIRESYDQIKCNFLHQRIVSSLKWSEEFDEELPEMESNSLFYCRFVGDTAVFATDYIDQDDLHPYQSKDRIRKDVSSGVVLTSHVDEDGKRYVVMKKFLMAKFHMYPHKLSEKLTNILFDKMPCVSQKVTKLIDQKMLDSRNTPPGYCAEALAAQSKLQQQQQTEAQTHVSQQC